MILIFAASTVNDRSLFFAMAAATCFVFEQIPINDANLSRYVPKERRGRNLSIKFLLNLCVGASVLPISSLIIQRDDEFNNIFFYYDEWCSLDHFFWGGAAVILPN